MSATAAIDARIDQTSDAASTPAPESLAENLIAASADPVLLVEERDGIVARTATGAMVRKLIGGPVSRAAYDPGIAVVWFLRGHQLEAIDVAGVSDFPVVIIDDMPDIVFDAGRGTNIAHPMCDACVTISAVPPAVGVTSEAKASGGQLQGREWRRFERDRNIAAKAHPRLADTATEFLNRIGRREPRAVDFLLLGHESWPLPRSAGSRPKQIKWGGEMLRIDCAAGCGHGFRLEKLGWVLLVAGRGCDCGEDRCWSTCVLFDPASKEYARPSRPQLFSGDATPESACHPTFDRSGTAYILDEHRVCTAAGCTRVRGRILGWIEPGILTDNVAEDMSVCPE